MKTEAAPPISSKLEHAGSLTRMARRIGFSSAHLYSQPRFSEAENRTAFGKCFTPHGHGHNYILEAFVEGPIDVQTGMLINLIDIDKVLKDVVGPLDHQHLNFDITYFQDKIPTTEVIAQYCFRELHTKLKAAFPQLSLKLYKIRLFEMDDLYVEYSE